jgi:L-lactate utilization protein LutC
MKYDEPASEKSIQKTIRALTEKEYEAVVVDDEKSALEKIKITIPKGSSVMNGASVTLEQIGYTEYLKTADHGWDNLHAKVNQENDRAKRSLLRKQASLSDYYLGSVSALTETGEYIHGSNTGTQLPHIASTSAHLIFVVGTQKIVPDVTAGLDRLRTYILPLEEIHMRTLHGVGTNLNKILITSGEMKLLGRTILFILVKKKLGF